MGLLVIQDMPALSASNTPNEEEQAEFQRQLELMINEHKSHPSIYSWVIYNEGWGQRHSDPAPEGGLTEVIRKLDSTRLINSISGWNDHGYGDYHVSRAEQNGAGGVVRVARQTDILVGQPQLRAPAVWNPILLTAKNAL